jgi:hypothetical protein
MPSVVFIACLDLEQESSFMDGHQLSIFDLTVAFCNKMYFKVLYLMNLQKVKIETAKQKVQVQGIANFVD